LKSEDIEVLTSQDMWINLI